MPKCLKTHPPGACWDVLVSPAHIHGHPTCEARFPLWNRYDFSEYLYLLPSGSEQHVVLY